MQSPREGFREAIERQWARQTGRGQWRREKTAKEKKAEARRKAREEEEEEEQEERARVDHVVGGWQWLSEDGGYVRRAEFLALIAPLRLCAWCFARARVGQV